MVWSSIPDRKVQRAADDRSVGHSPNSPSSRVPFSISLRIFREFWSFLVPTPTVLIYAVVSELSRTDAAFRLRLRAPEVRRRPPLRRAPLHRRPRPPFEDLLRFLASALLLRSRTPEDRRRALLRCAALRLLQRRRLPRTDAAPTNTGSQGPKLRRDSEAVLRSSSPLRQDVLSTTATGVHRSKIRSGFSLRATLLSAVFAFFVTVASGDSAVPSNACRTIKNAGYKIGFYLNGQAFSPTFNGAEIDLLQHYNAWALETRPTTFEPTTARLLLGYDGSSFALPYLAGEVVDLGGGSFHFNSHPNQTVKLDQWIHLEDGFNFTGETNEFDFGDVDPVTVTFVHDVIFAGAKKIDVATRVEAANIDYRITYKEGNHFDLTHWVSVNSDEDLETLIGVVDGKKVLRKECYLQMDTAVFTVCDAKVCKYVKILRDVGSFCFSIAGCRIASGPEGLFDTIVVIPKDPIAKPHLPTTTGPRTTTAARPSVASRRPLPRPPPQLPKSLRTLQRPCRSYQWRSEIS
ncbi:hypothetical protein L596_010305 [Steinernema carpocapsae]|uniref:Uncharacterized protein n=1 Tax=Steinernema carpocapsae TaxID=34508 RepID=A0A4U5PHX6_STECR|nr:hypothetical protein L596_010305 [Steinernema carpocapsae]